MGKNIFVLLFRKVIGALVSMLCTTLIIKNISIGDYGIYTVFLNTIAMFSTFATLGVDSSSAFVLQNKKYDSTSALINVFLLGIIISAISFFLFFIIFYHVHISDFNMIPYNIKFYMVISSVFMLLANILFSILMGKMHFNTYAIFTFIPNLTLIIALFITTRFFHLTLEKTSFYFMLGYLLTIISLVIYLLIEFQILKNLDRFSIEISKYILKYGFLSYASNIITFLNFRVNIFIIGYFLTSNAVGYYSSCLVVIDLFWLISGTIANITYPFFSKPDSGSLRKKFIPLITRNILFITLLGNILFYLAGNYIIPILFGKEFLVIRNLLLILAPGVVLLAGAKIMCTDFTAQGKPKINIYINGITFVFTIISNLLLIPRLGLNGAALSTSISFFVFFVLTVIIYTKMTNTRIIDYIIPKLSDVKLIINSKN